MKPILVCTLLALGSAGIAAAATQEPAAVAGRVTNASGAPLAGAVVRITALQAGTVTRPDGSYRLVVPAGRLPAAPGQRYTVTASTLGYQTLSARITLALGATVTQDFVLEPAAVALEGIVVNAATAEAQRVRIRGANSVSTAADAGAYSTAAPAPPGQVTRGEFNTENYAAIDESPFLAVRGNPLSTFSIDVDRASYSNVRRFLRAGQAPPKDAVRIEELLNYFPYAYPEPRGEHPFSVVAEVGPCPWNPGHRLVHVGLQGRHVDTRELPASTWSSWSTSPGRCSRPTSCRW